MFKRAHGCMQALWRMHGIASRLQRCGVQMQQLAATKGGLLLDPVYQSVYKRCQALFKKQKGTCTTDPRDHTQQSTFTEDELVKIIDEVLPSLDYKDARDLAMLLLMVVTAGRGDDCRWRRICELLQPILRTCIGESINGSRPPCQACTASLLISAS